MTRIANKPGILAGIVLASICAVAAAADERNLFAHCTGSFGVKEIPIWLVTVDERNKAEESSILLREKIGEETWAGLMSLRLHVLAVTGHSSELVVLINRRPHNSWMWVSGSRSSYGPSLPDEAEIIAIAGDRRSLWALAQPSVAAPPAPTTSPATTRPITKPGPALYLLAGETWTVQQREWPADLPISSPDDVSMAMIDGRPSFAVRSGTEIQVIAHQDQKWRRLDRRTHGPAPNGFKLLAIQNRWSVWIQPDGDPTGRIWRGAQTEFTLSAAGAQPTAEDVAVTIAEDNICLFWKAEKKIYGQRYTMDGAPSGQIAEVKMERRRDMQTQWIVIALAAVAGIVLLNIILRRRAAREQDEHDPDDE